MSTELEKELIQLLETHEELFEEIEQDLEELDPEDRQEFFADGEAGILKVGTKTYRFSKDEVSEIIGDEIYEW
ncbi:hypothetical protein [Nostoc sp. ChiVER01]|uniref:hypothetical protein n=1 Tax=Nostoc sp. ChiVER01 TaxID=3075382 RepID=UPI002AD2C265|nr:hypothetical protein [Nostoc sp. ChiVER01]MDZ8227025.1 hypothetical protein [Nostoc sp. ChiVER01]